MSVSKYRDVSEMPPLARVTGEDLARRIRRVWARARRFSPPSYTPGVQKFTDILAAQQARDRDRRRRILQLQKRRRKPE